MSSVLTLMRFEYKKIFQRKITWITLAVLTFVIQASVFLVLGGVHQSIKEQREAELEYTGTEVDTPLLETAQRSYGQTELNYQSNNYRTEEDWNDYCDYIRPYISLSTLVSQAGLDMKTSDLSTFYEARTNTIHEILKASDLNEGEIAEHLRREEEVSKPFLYSYSQGYKRFFQLQYTTSLFTAFAVLICIAGIFAGEYSSKVDSLMLSAKYGKNKAIIAKLCTVLSFAGMVSLVSFLGEILSLGMLYGFEGATAPIQLYDAACTYHLNMIQTVLLLILCATLAVCMTAVIGALISAGVGTSVSVIILGTIGTFGTMLLNVSEGYALEKYDVLYFLFSLIPANVCSMSTSVSIHFLKLGSHYFTSWQYIPVIYLTAMVLIGAWTYRIFKKHQIK